MQLLTSTLCHIAWLCVGVYAVGLIRGKITGNCNLLLIAVKNTKPGFQCCLNLRCWLHVEGHCLRAKLLNCKYFQLNCLEALKLLILFHCLNSPFFSSLPCHFMHCFIDSQLFITPIFFVEFHLKKHGVIQNFLSLSSWLVWTNNINQSTHFHVCLLCFEFSSCW